jgi:hypothetical protein
VARRADGKRWEVRHAMRSPPILMRFFHKHVSSRRAYGSAFADLSIPLAAEQARLEDAASGHATVGDIAEDRQGPSHTPLSETDERSTPEAP